MVSLISKSLEIVASCTVTAIAGLVKSKAITVEFQTFCFFAVAEDLLVWVYLFRYRP